MPTRLLEGFPYHRIFQGFTIVEVTGGLIQHQASLGVLLDHEKLAVLFYNSSYSYMGAPAHAAHLTISTIPDHQGVETQIHAELLPYKIC